MKDNDEDAEMATGRSGARRDRDTPRRQPPRSWPGRLRRGGLIVLVALSVALAGILVQQSFGAAPVSAPAPPVTPTPIQAAAALVSSVSPTPPSSAVPPTAPAPTTELPSATPSGTATASPPPTATPSAVPSPTATATSSATPSETATASPTAPATPSAAPPRTATASPRATAREQPPTVNVYAATMAGKIGPKVVGLPERVYVPNSGDGTVDVINPATFQVVSHYFVGAIPHHITPAWDLTRLYVDTEGSSSLTVIDPRTGKPAGTIPVPNAYNLYFTPDGSKAIVVVERFRRLEFRNPHTWRLIKSVGIPWPGVDHLDFSADGRYCLASTEYSGVVVKVDTIAMKVTGRIDVGGLPIDVRLAPDGSVFYVANQGRNGVSIIDPIAMKEVGFIPTGKGAHGLEVSRDTKSLYVSNRLAGTISVITFKTRRVAATWHIGGSPDMLQLSPDGRQLWVSGRYDGAVYVVDARTGRVLHTIAVGLWPHGLTYFPNPGRFSLGHNGVYR